MRGRLKAIVLLALALVRTLWRLLIGSGRNGLARFRENYAEDGLISVSPEDREAMKTFGRCIACGRCDEGDAERIVSSAGRYRGTMSLVLAASRSMPDFRSAREGFAELDERALADKERLCPTGVPIARIARFVLAHADAAKISVPAARGEKRTPSSIPPASRRAAG